jgi:hypothetical protein
MRVAVITTCKGRLTHLKQMSERLMADPRVGRVSAAAGGPSSKAAQGAAQGDDWGWVLVDFACPDGSGAWVKERWGDRAEVVALEVPPEHPFNKPLALNSGAMRAVELGAQYLCFLDADTLVEPEFFDVVESALSLDSFLIVPPSQEKRDLTGFVCVNHRNFMRVGGYDIGFSGWGAEDLEFRLKLYLRGGLRFVEVPALASSIPHTDEVRMAHYGEKDKDVSHRGNLNRLCENVYQWTGQHLLEMYSEPKRGAELRRLLGVEAVSPRVVLL